MMTCWPFWLIASMTARICTSRPANSDRLSIGAVGLNTRPASIAKSCHRCSSGVMHLYYIDETRVTKRRNYQGEAMKPTAAPGATAGSPDRSRAAKLSVADQLRDVDMTVLDQLVAISQEEARLREYRERADQMKGNVSEAVYRRVVDDYEKRSAALEQQAAPL